MLALELSFFSGIIFFGGISSYSDFRQGIIPNKLILIGLVCCIPLHILSLCCGMIHYYPSWVLNMLIADLFSLVLYFSKLWAAGDAKLFILLYLYLPPSLFEAGDITYSIVPFVFIFLPALAWVLFDSVIRMIRKEPKKRNHFDTGSFFLHCVVIVIESTAAYCFFTIVGKDFILKNGMFTTLLIMIYAYFCASYDYMKKWFVVGIHLLLIFFAWVNGNCIISIPDWKSYALMIAVVGMRIIASQYNYQFIETSKVKKGMILSAETVLQFQKSKVYSLPIDPSEELTSRISQEEADAVQRWENTKNGMSHIWIVRKVPFAIMISLGFAMWFFVRIAG